MNRLVLKPCSLYGMCSLAPAIVNIIIKCGADSVVDKYTLLKPQNQSSVNTSCQSD